MSTEKPEIEDRDKVILERFLYSVSLANQEKDRIKDWLQDNRDICVYCGLDAEHRDHLVPEPWTGISIRTLIPTVPSCADCNMRIGDAPIISIAARAEIVAKSLSRKYKKSLDIPDRSEEELSKFGRNLREKIRSFQYQRVLTRYRLQRLLAGGATSFDDSGAHTPEIDAEAPLLPS